MEAELESSFDMPELLRLVAEARKQRKQQLHIAGKEYTRISFAQRAPSEREVSCRLCGKNVCARYWRRRTRKPSGASLKIDYLKRHVAQYHKVQAL